MCEGDELMEKLQRRFGPAAPGTVTYRLFEKLVAIVEDEGERAYQVIASAAVDALGKEKPSHYFAAVVVKRLQERRIVQLADF